MKNIDRRNFIKLSGLAAVPAFLPASAQAEVSHAAAERYIRFSGDGELYAPAAYLEQLQAVNPLEQDFYGEGGAVAALQKKMEALTGKDRAIFMPTGTMANQLAIAVLSGEATKVFVQDTSHVYRDEADAAQSVFNKRLMPLAKDKTYFTADELKSAIDNLGQLEVFGSGIGAVSIENPVRRTKGCFIPLEEIKKISAYCRSNNIKLHLDGARIYLASAWSGVSIKEYASYFDTIYISLYKYLGASAGAVLCGDKSIIEKMPHLIKIHGGTMFGNWTNAAMAVHRMEGMETLLQNARKRGDEIFTAINQIKGLHVAPQENGTNIFDFSIDKSIDAKKLHLMLFTDFKIRMPKPGDDNRTTLSVNETILYQDAAFVIDAFRKSAG